MFQQWVPHYFSELENGFAFDDREKIRYYTHKSKAAFQYLGIDKGWHSLHKIEEGIWNQVESQQLKREFDWLQNQLPTVLEEVNNFADELKA